MSTSNKYTSSIRLHNQVAQAQGATPRMSTVNVAPRTNVWEKGNASKTLFKANCLAQDFLSKVSLRDISDVDMSAHIQTPVHDFKSGEAFQIRFYNDDLPLFLFHPYNVKTKFIKAANTWLSDSGMITPYENFLDAYLTISFESESDDNTKSTKWDEDIPAPYNISLASKDANDPPLKLLFSDLVSDNINVLTRVGRDYELPEKFYLLFQNSFYGNADLFVQYCKKVAGLKIPELCCSTHSFHLKHTTSGVYYTVGTPSIDDTCTNILKSNCISLLLILMCKTVYSNDDSTNLWPIGTENVAELLGHMVTLLGNAYIYQKNEFKYDKNSKFHNAIFPADVAVATKSIAIAFEKTYTTMNRNLKTNYTVTMRHKPYLHGGKGLMLLVVFESPNQDELTIDAIQRYLDDFMKLCHTFLWKNGILGLTLRRINVEGNFTKVITSRFKSDIIPIITMDCTLYSVVKAFNRIKISIEARMYMSDEKTDPRTLNVFRNTIITELLQRILGDDFETLTSIEYDDLRTQVVTRSQDPRLSLSNIARSLDSLLATKLDKGNSIGNVLISAIVKSTRHLRNK